MRKKRSPKSWMTFFVRKLCLFLVTMIGITFLSFCLTYFSPSDPAEMIYQAQGIVPTDEMLAVTRERMGLNRPMLVQYGSWLLDLGRGNMGTSIKSGNPVLQDMLKVQPQAVMTRFRFDNPELRGEELLEAVCKGRGFLMKGGVCDYDRCCAVVLDEFRAGKLGRMTLEMPFKKARLTIPGAKKDDENKPQEETTDGED